MKLTDAVINNIAILSSISEKYSPEGKTLFSVSVLESDLSETKLIKLIQNKNKKN